MARGHALRPAVRVGRGDEVGLNIDDAHSDAVRVACVLDSASGWAEVADDASGDVYYWQESTGVTTWDRPVGR